ncbi:MAG: nucleoside recognition domain-containing protein [Bacillota bacterium]|nr:nucleoside recognition domain-containing protein [Bacillota bacterium]
MILSLIWLAFVVIALIFSLYTGTEAAVGAAALEGAGAAVEFLLAVGGIICLWCAVMELMRCCGIADVLARALRPALRRLFPGASEDREIMQALSANVSANLLGLGNAATPMGIQAARGMARLGESGIASDELCRLVVLNTASIQLLPTTIAAIRAAEGADTPFDILPAVWISSAVSVIVGLAAARLMEKRK